LSSICLFHAGYDYATGESDATTLRSFIVIAMIALVFMGVIVDLPGVFAQPPQAPF
jgi:hypothetical protein